MMNIKNDLSDVTIIIRSVGERTTELCEKLIIAQGASNQNLFIISVSPFSAALKKCYELGISEGKKWTLCIDADVLAVSGSIVKLKNIAEKTSKNTFEIQPLVCDWLFGGIRTAGVHMYRTSLLKYAQSLVPEAADSLRPENHVLTSMQKRGFPYIVCDNKFGLHDFEQSHIDIYRKCFLQGKKHIQLAPMLFNYWHNQENNDFRSAVIGFSDGIKANTVIVTSNVKKKGEVLKILPKEKLLLNISEYSPEKINTILKEFKEDASYKQHLITGYRFVASSNYLYTFCCKFQALRRNYGVFRGSIILSLVFLDFITYQLKKRIST